MKPYYEDDWVTIYHGDCLDVIPHIGSVDLALTDPPYGTTMCPWDSIVPLPALWKVLPPEIPVVLTASQPFTTTLISSNLKEFKYCWVWDKKRPSNPFQAKQRPLKVHEDVVVFRATPQDYSPQGVQKVKNQRKLKGATASNSDHDWTKRKREGYSPQFTGYPKSIITIPAESHPTHPTGKPVKLMEYLVNTYSSPTEAVLDFAMGSGTTGVACRNLNRRFVGIEIEEKYCEIAANRMAQEVMDFT